LQIRRYGCDLPFLFGGLTASAAEKSVKAVSTRMPGIKWLRKDRQPVEVLINRVLLLMFILPIVLL
jgi:hypothetical protein